jgi:hypothetical protein
MQRRYTVSHVVTSEQDRCNQVAQIASQMGAIARQVVELSLSADRSAACWDIDALANTSERLVEAFGRYGDLYRGLLAVWLGEPITSGFANDPRPIGPEMSSL